MKYEPLIVEEWDNCAAEKVLLIDDAYDPPSFSDENAGQLLELLQDGKRTRLVPDKLLDAGTAGQAIDDLSAGSYDTDAVQDAYAAVYRTYAIKRDAKADLDGYFKDRKEAALEKLDGLVALLRECKDLQLEFAGNETAEEIFVSFAPHILFMDYYLSQSDGTSDDATKGADENRSIKLVKRLLAKSRGAGPSVVLMSSENIEDEGGAYRAELEGAVLALRFGFLHKDGVAISGKALAIESKAADLLLDTAQGFSFGKDVEQALAIWRKGAGEALDLLQQELRELDVRDFAYLLRFRLKDEGESFADYLEWFLGESLRGKVDETVQWDKPAFSRIDKPENYQAIEGGHPQPSDRIAQLFHRLRISMPTKRSKKRFALGDLYVNEKKDAVRVVLSPDCDLVPRSTGMTSAKRLLTLGGELKALETDDVFIGDLVMFGEETRAIKWAMKDIATTPIGKTGKLEVDGVEYTLFGTLRPQHAQHIQTQAFADLRRVGLAVAPAVYRTALVEAVVTLKSGKRQTLAPEELKKYPATLLFAREGSGTGHHVLFDRSYVRALLASLSQLDPEKLQSAEKSHLKNFLTKTAQVTGPMQREGLMIGAKGPFGSRVSKNAPAKEGGWLQFVISLDAQ